MLSNVGPLEIGIVVVIALLVFSKRLPELGGSLGKGIRGFGRGLKGEADPPVLPEQAAAPTAEEAGRTATGS